MSLDSQDSKMISMEAEILGNKLDKIATQLSQISLSLNELVNLNTSISELIKILVD